MSDYDKMTVEDFEAMIQRIKAEANEQRERRKRESAQLKQGVYDSAALRAAKGDVARAMRNCERVPMHFEYVNVAGNTFTKVMI